MIDYLKLDTPNYKERYDTLKFVEEIKTIVDELKASNCRAIQIVGLILKCKKAKESNKTYTASKVNSITW